jgi:hypothetical protein
MSRSSESEEVKPFATSEMPQGVELRAASFSLVTNKWLGAVKSAKVLQRLTSTNEKEHSHAQNEDQERR